MPDWENVLLILVDHVGIFMTTIKIVMDNRDITGLRQIVPIRSTATWS